jgi:hypothetical protein
MIGLSAIRTGEIDAAFLSGSPIDLLPIAAIEEVRLASPPIRCFNRINKAYQQISPITWTANPVP